MRHIKYLILLLLVAVSCKKEDTVVPNLDTPTNLTASIEFSDRIELSWGAVAEAENYIIYRASGTLTDDPATLAFNIVGSSAETSYEDTSVSPESSYYYQVEAENETASSELSAPIYGETIADIVDPSDPNAIARALIITGNVTNGNPPPPTTSDPNQPLVFANQTSARVSAGNTLFLPFSYSSTGTGAGYAGCYVQVPGASTFWDIPATGNTPADGQIVIPVGIPSNVADGEFCLVYCIYNNDGSVSNLLQTCVTVAPPQSCPGFESGSDGLTIFTYDLGEDAGVVTINYETYTIPDRIDVFFGGQWIDGTGSPLGSGQFPPPMDCNGTIVDGYVGANGSFTFNYDPNVDSSVDVYVSGCIGGGTAWDISVSCPE